MTRRYYRIRELEDVKAFTEDGRSVRHRRFRAERRPARADLDASPTTTTCAAALVALNTEAATGASSRRNVVTDIYLSWPDAPADGDQVSTALHDALVPQPALAGGRRVTVTVCRTGEKPVQQFTFRPSGDGLAEERVIRDMHPLTGQRLDLWRLKNFTGTRMPARGGHLPVPPGRAEQPGRRTAGRPGRGPRRHAAAGRRRQGRRVPGGRAGAGVLPGEHPPGAGAAQRAAAAGQQPGVPARVAADRGAAVRPRRVRADEHAADAGHRPGRDHRAGPAAGGRTARSTTWRCGSPTRPAPA